MSVGLEVRDVTVLFAGEPQPSPVDGSARGIISTVDPTTLGVTPGHRLGLAHVSFTVQAGDCLAVLGASGSGKSSLLRTLAGLQLAGRGSIRVNGREVSALPPEQRSIVYLHQEPVLFPHLSVLDNVAFPLTVRGMARRNAERRAVETMFRLGVAELAGNRANALSGGQRHRVALARALCADPAVLLLDEPLSALDPEVRRSVRDALLEARRASGAATILVTHDLDDAMAVGTHIAAIGPFADLSQPTDPVTLLRHPPSLTVARLLGAFAEVEGTVHAGHFRWIGGSVRAPDVPDGRATACVRAHDVRILHAGTADAPTLTVVGRREALHEVLLEVRDSADCHVTLRVPVTSGVRVGEQIHVELHDARLFATA